MGTIIKRTRANGDNAYMAQIALTREGKTHREAKTFDREKAAKAWLEKREAELSKPGAIAAASAPSGTPTLADAIDKYLATSRKAIGRTKAQVLRTIRNDDFGALHCQEIGSQQIRAYAERLGETAKPQTVNNYMAHLSAIFAIAETAWGFPLDYAAMTAARPVMKRLGLTAKSGERERRPTLDELDRLLAHFDTIRRRRPNTNPMRDIVLFSLFAAKRQEEVTRALWADLDEAGSRVMIRDMKNPGDKKGNNVWCDLPAPALAVVLRQPRDDKFIFPYNPDAISAAFTRACKFLAIHDLHFHDLRHEGISRLFEMGLNIPHVAAVSGHRSWQSLKRYTHLRERGDKYEGWKWMPII